MPTRRRTMNIAVAILGALAVVTSIALPNSIGPFAIPSAAAADGSQFQPDFIISDDNLYDGNAMTPGQVQSFLDRNNRCGSAANCLAAYRQDTPAMPQTQYCAALDARKNLSAAEIISRVGVACGFSQSAILVILQKEQGLVTSSSPSSYALMHAMGQACPDTAPCDPAFSGFFYQVYYGARQFQSYRQNADWSGWNYHAGRWNTILYHPDATRNCGSERVFIQNQATAALYIYTPYVPNSAALRNLYGEGDRCSSYGNRNFWRLWTDWFGDPRVNAKSPIGVINDMWTTEDGVAFWGWALDPDEPTAAVDLRIEIAGTTTYWSAGSNYPEVASGFPGAGPNHGFGGTVAAPPGTTQKICVTVVNRGGGSDTSLGCRSVDLPPRASPRGELKDMWATTAGAHLWGWSIDPDAVDSSVPLHIQVDGRQWYVLTADAPYPLGPELVEGADYLHGFGGSLPLSPGKHQVCAFMVNRNAGSNVPFACRELTVPTVAEVSPKGEVKEVTATAEGVALWGWAIDPDSKDTAVRVIVQLDSQWYAWSADSFSAAALATYPDAGPNHGWGGVLDAAPGMHWLCVTYLNVGDGADVNAGCRQVHVPEPTVDVSPHSKMIGAYPSPGGLTLWGYAFDPDSLESPTDVIVQVDSQWLRWPANASYAPGADLFPGVGTSRGFVGEVAVPPGRHWVCTYAVNRNAGADTAPQCVQVTTP